MILAQKIGFIRGTRKSARHIPQCLRTSQPAGRNGTTADKPIGYGRPPSLRNGVFLPFRHSSSHVGIHRSDGTAYRKGRTDRTGKQRAKALPSPVGTIYAVIADAGLLQPKSLNSLSPHDRNVQERPRPDRRTETPPRSVGNVLAISGAKSLFNHHAKFTVYFRIGPDFRISRFESSLPYIDAGRTPSENTMTTILTDTDGQP